MICPLCGNSGHEELGPRKGRPAWYYFRCKHCFLVFRDPETLPGPDQEKERYLAHCNDPRDPGYRRFLSRIILPVKTHCPPPAAALDFGCGPAPLLCEILRAEDYDARAWDPQFFPDKDCWNQTYNLITATEVIEHLHRPAEVLDRLVQHLSPQGLLALMTQPVPEKDFASWHYLSDLTHVIFFSRPCFEWVAEKWGLTLEWFEGDLWLLRKN